MADYVRKLENFFKSSGVKKKAALKAKFKVKVVAKKVVLATKKLLAFIVAKVGKVIAIAVGALAVTLLKILAFIFPIIFIVSIIATVLNDNGSSSPSPLAFSHSPFHVTQASEIYSQKIADMANVPYNTPTVRANGYIEWIASPVINGGNNLTSIAAANEILFSGDWATVGNISVDERFLLMAYLSVALEGYEPSDPMFRAYLNHLFEEQVEIAYALEQQVIYRLNNTQHVWETLHIDLQHRGLGELISERISWMPEDQRERVEMTAQLRGLVNFVDTPFATEREFIDWTRHVVPHSFGNSTMNSQYRNGIRIAGEPMRYGTNVTSGINGTVVYVRTDAVRGIRGFGNIVQIMCHNENTIVTYSHLRSSRVQLGQTVNAGDVIGQVGNSGADEWRDGILYVEIKAYTGIYGWVIINPLFYMRSQYEAEVYEFAPEETETEEPYTATSISE